jgi:hypothetical protein
VVAVGSAPGDIVTSWLDERTFRAEGGREHWQLCDGTNGTVNLQGRFPFNRLKPAWIMSHQITKLTTIPSTVARASASAEERIFFAISEAMRVFDYKALTAPRRSRRLAQGSLRRGGLRVWALGTHFGPGVSQSALGDLLGQVRDETPPGQPESARGDLSRRELSLHVDLAQIVGLMCVRQARQGGYSQYASGLAVHNEILATRPDLMPVLYRGFHIIVGVRKRRPHRRSPL